MVDQIKNLVMLLLSTRYSVSRSRGARQYDLLIPRHAERALRNGLLIPARGACPTEFGTRFVADLAAEEKILLNTATRDVSPLISVETQKPNSTQVVTT